MLALGYGASLFTEPYWFYGTCVAPVCGAFVGAAMYDIAIFTGGERYVTVAHLEMGVGNCADRDVSL
jgi:hypothetical protein